MAKMTDIAAQVAELVPSLEKPAFFPVVENVVTNEDDADDETPFGTDDPQASKFGGQPLLSREHGWPSCGKCKARMGFVMQIIKTELPDAHRAALKGDLLQVFWCRDCQDQGGSEDLFSKSALVREIGIADALASEADEGQTITFLRSWRPMPTFPSAPEELKWAKIAKGDLLDAIMDALSEKADAAEEDEEGEQRDVRLGGWLRWTSAARVVKCKCKAPLMPLLQLGQLGPMAGDGHTVTVMRCGSCGNKALLSQ